MSINTDYLKAFLTIHSTGTFTKASQKLFLSQSALSQKIARLEDELAKTSRWIKWDGKGEACPVSEITQVVVRHRSGEQSLGYALEFWWFSKDRNCVSSYMVLPS